MDKNGYYILTQPSWKGMGSDSDYALVTEENLHKLMTEEEIERKLKECSTYDEVPDLMELPDDIPVTIENIAGSEKDGMSIGKKQKTQR